MCCSLIHFLWGIHCTASRNPQADRRVGRTTSLTANQRWACLFKPPGDDIHTLDHPADNAAVVRSERDSYVPCLKIRLSDRTWHILTFDRCSAFTHSAHPSHPAQRNKSLGSSVCADEWQFSHHPTTSPPYPMCYLLFSLMCHTQSIKEGLVIKWNWFIFNVCYWRVPSWKPNTWWL